MDRRQADGRHRRRRCWRRVIVADPRAAARRRRRRRRCTWPAPPGRLNPIDFHFDSQPDLHVLVGPASAACSCMLSYFGCDQSQVQRYLTAKSVNEARHSLLMSAFVKIPLQALVLLIGVLVFVFYLFNQPPMLFNDRCVVREDPAERARRRATTRSRRQFTQRLRARRDGGDGAGRRRAATTRTPRGRVPRGDDRRAGGPRPGGRRWRQERRRGRLQGHHRRHADAGRQLRLSDVRHDAAADGPGRA